MKAGGKNPNKSAQNNLQIETCCFNRTIYDDDWIKHSKKCTNK